jgi:glucokinase
MHYSIGVDVGGTKSLALLIDEEHRVVGESRESSPHNLSSAPGDDIANVIAAQVTSLCQTASLDVTKVPIGIGLPGLVRRDGSLAYAPNLKTASGVNLPHMLAERLGAVSVVVENDGNCAAVAEHRLGAGVGTNDMVMVTLGTGIGGGLIVNGELVRGHNGFGGEIGHMIVEAGGVLCECGVRGCWERYCSGSGLARLAREWSETGRLPTLAQRHPEGVTGQHVTAGADEGLSEALELLDHVGWWLAVGVGSLAVVLDVRRFVVGGGLWSAAHHLVPAATKYLAQTTEGLTYREPIELVAATLGSQAGAIGAALVARHQQP